MNELVRREKQLVWREFAGYRLVEVLGKGTYGMVYKAIRQQGATQDFVALKRTCLTEQLKYGVPETALREISILKDLDHENILRVSGFSCTVNRLYIVCELLDLDLKQYMKSQAELPVSAVRVIMTGILRGLAHCHAHRVLHRDIKPHNVLVSANLDQVKLGDFGLSRGAFPQGHALTQEVVTLWYRAPGLLLGDSAYDESIDVWALGCVFAEMLVGYPVFAGDSEIETLLLIFKELGTLPPALWPVHAKQTAESFPRLLRPDAPFGQIDDSCSRDLLLKLLEYDPVRRITCKQALEHPFITGLPTIPSPLSVPTFEEMLHSEFPLYALQTSLPLQTARAAVVESSD